jgi:Pyruvate/2-oxoacid:ferredoxin oxidoreductase delta subunit
MEYRDLTCPWCSSLSVHSASWREAQQLYYKRKCLKCERSVCYSPEISPNSVKISYYAFENETTSSVTTEKETIMKKRLFVKIVKLFLVYLVVKFVVNHSFLKDYLKDTTKNIVDELKTFLD